MVHRGDIDWTALQPLANDDIDQQLSVQENELAVTLSLAASPLNGWLYGLLPADYKQIKSAFDAGGAELTLTDINGLIGRPSSARYCAVSGGKLYAAIASVNVVYSGKAPLLVAGSDHSWLSDQYSTVLVYGLLKHAAHRIQDFDARDQHQGMFDTAVGTANANYAMQTLAAGMEPRSPYAVVSN